MTHRLAVLSILAGALALGACKKDPPQEPAPLGGGAGQQTGAGVGGAGAGGVDPAAAQREETLRALAVLQEMIHFDYDQHDLRSDAQAILMRKVPILRANTQVRLRIEGHADERGSLEYNQALGQRRANTTRDYLVYNGIDVSRLEVVSFGEDRPLDSRSTEDAWARNRRAEFQVTAGGDRIIMPVTQ